MKYFLSILLIGTAFLGTAQSGTHKEKMKALKFMVGTWTGGGWRMNQMDRTREEFTQEEIINYELNGGVLLVRGKGFSTENELVHNALGTIFYDTQAGTYKMFAILENGMKTDANLEVLDFGKLNWWFETASGTVKYSITLEDNVWTEKGEFSPDKENWYPFMQFSLTKN